MLPTYKFDYVKPSDLSKGDSTMNKCVVLFSGGLDSSLAACLMLEKNYDIDLLHYDQGALITNGLYQIRADEIKRAYPQREINLYDISICGIFRKLALVSIEQDILKYQHSLVCLGCKLAMHLQTIIYCRENSISIVVDGSAQRQSRYAEQSLTTINYLRELYCKYGIQYQNPIYDLEKGDVKYGLFDREITIQPLEDTCLFSHTFTSSPDSSIMAYINDKEEIIKELIERRFGNEKN